MALPWRTSLSPEELRADFDQLQASLQRIGTAPNVSPNLAEATNELRRTLALFDAPLPAEADQLRRLEVGLFGGLDALLARIAKLARLEPLAPDALDGPLKGRYLASDGRWRIEIAGADGIAASRFAVAVRKAAPLAVGPALAPYAASSPWPKPLAMAGAFAALLVFLIGFRRIPNILAAAASFATTLFLFVGLMAVAGVTPTFASLPVFLIYLVASVGSIGGGWLSGSLIKRGWSAKAARKTAMLICALAVVPIVFASKANSLWVATALIAVATLMGTEIEGILQAALEAISGS